MTARISTINGFKDVEVLAVRNIDGIDVFIHLDTHGNAKASEWLSGFTVCQSFETPGEGLSDSKTVIDELFLLAEGRMRSVGNEGMMGRIQKAYTEFGIANPEPPKEAKE